MWVDLLCQVSYHLGELQPAATVAALVPRAFGDPFAGLSVGAHGVTTLRVQDVGAVERPAVATRARRTSLLRRSRTASVSSTTYFLFSRQCYPR
ncbi:MAG: hypothetical protein M3305_16205 [Actinomycetota bacterium]|nr:hypothetical protein [Actinomycetota bacterium]